MTVPSLVSAQIDLDALARAIAETLSGDRLSGYPGFRDIAATATDGMVTVALDNGIKFEMRLNAPKKERISNG